MANPVAAHTFDFTRVYLSTRTGGAPGSGVWTSPVTIFDGTLDSNFQDAQTFSAGALSAADHSGIVVNSSSASRSPNLRLVFCGNGRPTVPIEINFPGQIAGRSLSSDYWDLAQGAWTYNGARYIVLQNGGGRNPVTIIKSSDAGVTWAIQDGSNGPSGISGDGSLAAIQRVNNKICVFTPTDGTDTNFAIWEFDLTTDTWGASFAPINIPDFGGFGITGSDWINGLFKFPNGDYLVLYGSFTAAVCRLWSGGAWGSPQSFPGRTFANMVMDPSFGVVHIFTYELFSRYNQVFYSTYTHAGDVASGVLATIPGGVGDGVGHCSIQNGMLFVPRDYNADFDNAVWVGALPSPATLYKELLPIPVGEGNAINQASLNPVGTGYLVGDTGTVDGGVAGFLARYRVTAVGNQGIGSWSFTIPGTGYAVGDAVQIDGGSTFATFSVTGVDGFGAITSLLFTSLGTGYSVASGVTTTAISGVGTGFKLNILSVFNGVISLTLDYPGGGYSVANNVTTTPGGSQPGVGSGLTINILSLKGHTPSCAYMMFPNGYSFALSLECPLTATGEIGVPYDDFLILTGGTAPFTFAIIFGSLPPGLTLNTSTGEISGTPTTAGIYSYVARVTDADGNTAQTPGCPITITTLSINCPITNTFTVGVPYSGQVQVSGGVPPYTFAITAGSLPTGVTLDPSSGVISGTPTVGGTFSYTIQVTDSLGAVQTAGCALTVCVGARSDFAPPTPSYSADPCAGGSTPAIKSQL